MTAKSRNYCYWQHSVVSHSLQLCSKQPACSSHLSLLDTQKHKCSLNHTHTYSQTWLAANSSEGWGKGAYCSAPPPHFLSQACSVSLDLPHHQALGWLAAATALNNRSVLLSSTLLGPPSSWLTLEMDPLGMAATYLTLSVASQTPQSKLQTVLWIISIFDPGFLLSVCVCVCACVCVCVCVCLCITLFAF